MAGASQDGYGVPQPRLSLERRRRQVIGMQAVLLLEKLVVIPAGVLVWLEAAVALPVLAVFPAFILTATVAVGAVVAHAGMLVGHLRRESWAWDLTWTAGWGLAILDGIMLVVGISVTAAIGVAALLAAVVALDVLTLWQSRDAPVARHHHRASTVRRY